MIAADAQKYFALRLQPGLITDGMFRSVRHPNYLGEMMIYGSFALIVWHWLPVVVLAWVWGGLFAVNISLKEASMSRYPDWNNTSDTHGYCRPCLFRVANAASTIAHGMAKTAFLKREGGLTDEEKKELIEYLKSI
jgi:hypothetical protein